MAKLKIVSNPYERKVAFFTFWDTWHPINEVENANSPLIAKKYTEGFFPFRAHEIVQSLIDAYWNEEEPLELVFEGSDDEWSELREVCSFEEFNGKINLERGTRVLANARDILPLIRDVFEEIFPIIAAEADGQTEMSDLLRKFRDASSNVVPIVVVGNYSAGKSSFINALVGAEFLPSGDRPVTARLFQIEESGQHDRATIKFRYADEPVNITISDSGIRVSPPEIGGRVINEINAASAKCNSEDVIQRLREVLAAINSFRAKEGEPSLSDLIKVRVPFGGSVEWGSGKQVVIFDTPGSNSNSNIDHERVLRDAMRDMSDGLPIYVTGYDSLDSNDNAALYDQISAMPALDERFAMIVVNRADEADLPEDGFSDDEKDWLMDTVIASNLYGQGVFFVSSIVGLGAKTGGAFADRHYSRVFRRLRDSYSDPEDEDYMRLYDYNQMPEQLKVKLLRASEEYTNTALANSGLYCIEREIDEFATKYCAYNKCYQSDDFLRDLISRSVTSLEDKCTLLKSSQALHEDDLGASRTALVDRLMTLSRTMLDEAVSGYLPSMNEWAKGRLGDAELTEQQLSAWEEELTKQKQREMGAEEKRLEAQGKRTAVAANLRARVQNAWDTRDILGLAAIARSFASDYNVAKAAEAESEAAYQDADRFASDDLIALVRKRFSQAVETLSLEAEEQSKSYWQRRADESKETLLSLVSDGEAIDDEQREALRSIIVSYPDLVLSDERLRARKILYPFNPNKLWKAPLRFQYNVELSQRISRWRSVVEPAHEEGFREWLRTLTEQLASSAEGINPELRKKLEHVISLRQDIEANAAKRERLARAQERLSYYMKWQEA